MGAPSEGLMPNARKVDAILHGGTVVLNDGAVQQAGGHGTFVPAGPPQAPLDGPVVPVVNGK